MHLKKNIVAGKTKFFLYLIIIYQLLILNSYSENLIINEKFAELNILDKVSSKTSKVKVQIGEELIFQNLIINVLKCRNSKFDDNPEVTAYLQVRDLKSTDKDKVYIFNDWTFSSSPSIRPFDHPVYDIWLKKCYS
tara:strand:+ start:1555 stop:1962 length:408 start_codon:yes stop_codon:yes gene_type:complete